MLSHGYGKGITRWEEIDSMEMNRRNFVKASAYASLAGVAAVGMDGSAQQMKTLVGAYYFPNYHVDPRNESRHGKGWTEWEILKRGEPKFAGHQQPKRPVWGYEDESDPAVFEKKIAAAHHGGLTHFIFDWYWYEGKPFLEAGLEKGYQHARNKADVRFCLMWANHDWFDLMPARLHESQPPLLFPGTYNVEQFEAATDYIIAHYFSDPSYLCIDGAPYLSIYELKHLIDRMGGLELATKAFARFRDKTRQAGFKDLHLNVVAWGAQEIVDVQHVLKVLGAKSTTSYTWTHHQNYPEFPATEYRLAVEHAPDYWNRAEGIFGVPYHPNVSMGWDPSPRTCQSDKFERRGYPFMSVLKNNTPELFRKSLLDAKAYLDRHGSEPRIVTINAWNEWTEGSYLEPDIANGMAYLDAIESVFGS